MEQQWQQLAVPYTAERLSAFSLPRRGCVLVLPAYGDGEVYSIDLRGGPTVTAHADAGTLDAYFALRDASPTRDRVIPWDGDDYTMLGLMGGTPMLVSPADGSRVEVHEEPPARGAIAREVLVTQRDGCVALRHTFSDLSGDWCYATFADDGTTLLVGYPYGLFIFQRRVHP